ncbi:hypothetical protein I3760_05G178200 [Carya illinoinensis]|nr:hypothetical protein I3760_05G178200 [Carya illinoinensis]
MNSDPEDAKFQLTANNDSPKRKKKKKHRAQPELPPPSPTVQAQVQVIHEDPQKASPFVGYFPSGYDPSKSCGGSNSLVTESPSVSVYRSQKWPKRYQLVVSPTGSNVDFVGTNYSGEATAGQQCRYALGVFDKGTQSLKIAPVACGKIFRLEPKVRGLDVADEEPESRVKEELSAQQRVYKMRELTNLYGTKKSIKEAKKKHALNQEDDPKSQEELDGKIKEVKINKEALESTDAHIACNIPPYDSSATSPQEAYPLDKIILKGEWGFLEDIFELLQVGAEVATNTYPTFVCNRIYKLQEIQDEVEKRTLSCIFSYLTHLIKFKDQHSMDGVSSAKGHKIPSILFQKFSTMFSPASKRLSAEKNDLLISYVLVLTLYADEFRTNPSDIAKDLRTSSIKLRVHYEHLGCKLSRQNNLILFTLPLPLQFPTVRQKRRR